MIQMFVALICAASGVGDARVMVCSPVIVRMSATDCENELKVAQELAKKNPDVSIQAECVAPGDPA